MKNMKRILSAFLGCCLFLCSLNHVSAKDYSKAKYSKTRWDDIKEDYLDTSTDRLIFVKCKGGSKATVEMWKKVSETEKWKKIISCKAYTGSNGLGKKKQGDHKTPIGIFNITMAFGRKKSPGTAGISYTKLNKYHYWSSEKATYNQFVDVRSLGRKHMSGEHLINYNPHYNYALALDYNRKCTYLKGAAIFLHCFGDKTFTLGCIAVHEKNMKKIVRNTTKHTKICIYSEGKTALKKDKPVGVMSTAVNNQVAISWEPVSGAAGYEIYEAAEKVQDSDSKHSNFKLVARTKGCQAVLKEKEAGATYFYYIRSYQKIGDSKNTYSKKSEVVSTTVAVEGTSTIKNFLTTALAPIGSTMYVWGGGWNKADTAAGPEAKRIGLSPEWRSFAQGKNSSYDYKNYRYKIHEGLDCSGYVGWSVYNILNTKKNKKGYVYSASKQAKKFSELGFGSYKGANEIKNYKAGDIMSSACKCCGHVWIVVGECSDGSVVLLHSSPTGVQLNGTVTPKGRKDSQAVKLAKEYMKKYYKSWYQRYPRMDRGSSYLSHYGQMRWNTTGKNVVLSDPDGYQDKNAEKVLEDLFRH